ncbi:MAG: diaminopropionate ammonia-lyase [Lachnospiraceae bacterium]|nr:diaminopropionate ammonia-lyase [Lachnospiraceae bacterium]
MNRKIQAVHFNHRNTANLYPAERFGPENAAKVRRFHQSFPEYQATPLAALPALAKELGVASIHVKDESWRFGLNAFKVLGGSFAIGSYIAKRLDMDISELPYKKLISPEVREKLGDITFVTATDGNHGRGIAWTANRLRQKSVVYMPKGSAPERLKNIQALGAEASITELNYDDAVRLARKCADQYGWVLVQDTAWEGYEEIPGWIMEGYITMAAEAVEQLGGEKPTHVFLQAGVGAMAGAVCGYFAALYGNQDRPVITIVEPDQADCIFRTAKANDGKLHFVTGDMNSIMAGLCCGEPCSIGWNVLRDHTDHFISMPDYAAAKGMRVLGNPLPGDPRVISGESGAATAGFVAEVLTNPEMTKMKEALGLNADSRILCFSTEGDTDRENYRRIVWDGLFPSFHADCTLMSTRK